MVAVQRLAFVHVNDQHASFAPASPDPGDASPWARQRGLFEAVRAANPHTLFTNAGDDFEKGTVAEHLSEPRGAIVGDAVRLMRFDARCVGNHDFAHSLPVASAYTHDDHALVLCSNVTPAAGSELSPSWDAVPFGVIEVGELRVGFFALVSRPWDEMQTQPESLQFYGEALTNAWDFAEIARSVVAAHRDDVDLLVHLSHLGLADDEALCAEVGGIDVVLGGHSHSTLREVRTVNGATIIHCGAEGEFAGVLELEVRRGVVGAEPRCRVLQYELRPTAEQPVHAPTESALRRLLDRSAPGWGDGLCAAPGDGRIEAVSDFTARALLARQADAVLLDDHLAHLTSGWGWREGDTLRAQTFLEIFPIEIQLPGTEGTTALFASSVRAEGLAGLLAGVSGAPSARAGNCLAEYYSYLGVDVAKPRAWRLGLRDSEGVFVVEVRSSEDVKARAAAAVAALARQGRRELTLCDHPPKPDPSCSG